MKKLTVITMLLAAFVMGAAAQPRELSKEDKENVFNGKAKMMQKRLELTDEQMKEFLPVYKSYQEEIEKIERPKKESLKSETLTSDQAYDAMLAKLQFKEAVLAVQKNILGKLKPILTPQQLVRFISAESAVQKSIRDHKKARGGKGFKDGKRRDRGGKMSFRDRCDGDRPDSISCRPAPQG